jgi:hypothetical protein
MNKSKHAPERTFLKESHSKSNEMLSDNTLGPEYYFYFQRMAEEMSELARNISNLKKTAEVFKKRFHSQ